MPLERRLRQAFPADSPSEDASLANFAELEDEIARASDPRAREILIEEHNRMRSLIPEWTGYRHGPELPRSMPKINPVDATTQPFFEIEDIQRPQWADALLQALAGLKPQPLPQTEVDRLYGMKVPFDSQPLPSLNPRLWAFFEGRRPMGHPFAFEEP